MKIGKFVIGAALLALASCDQGNKFTVEGTIEGAEDSLLYFEAITLEGVQKLDSVKLKSDGSFCFKSDAPGNPEFYALRINSNRINFSVDSVETVTINASLPGMNLNYTVEGSESSEQIRQIVLRQAQLQTHVIAIEKSETLYPGEISDSVQNLVNKYKLEMRDEYILKNPGTAAAYYAVSQSIVDLYTIYQLFDPIGNRDDVKCYAAVANSWDALYPDAKRTEQICNMAIKGMQATAPPSQRVINVDESKISEAGIIEIELPDIKSQIRKITDLKGKVVLLDFTMYGAESSAERTRMMRQLYDKYKSQGLEIYQVSLDDDIHYWKLACENLPWICVHETNGSTSRTYGVVNVPTSFIINRDNEIVLRSENFTGSAEEEIQKYL